MDPYQTGHFRKMHTCAICRSHQWTDDSFQNTLCCVCNGGLRKIDIQIRGVSAFTHFRLKQQWAYEIMETMPNGYLEIHSTGTYRIIHGLKFYRGNTSKGFYMGGGVWKELDYLPCFGKYGICIEKPWLPLDLNLLPLIVNQWNDTRVTYEQCADVKTIAQLHDSIPSGIPVNLDRILKAIPLPMSEVSNTSTLKDAETDRPLKKKK
jgi:hypothetical protein